MTLPFLLSAAVVMDPPFGLNHVEWDDEKATFDGKKFETLIAQVRAISQAPNMFLFTYFNPLYWGDIHSALVKTQFQAVTPVYIYKAHSNVTGTNNYIHAVDPACIAVLPNRKAGVWNLSHNPLERHNIIVAPHLSRRQMSLEDKAINIHEKHPAVARQLCDAHVPVDGHVLVPFAGAGGEVVGAVQAGRNVTAIEKDTFQFRALCARLQQLATTGPDSDEVCRNVHDFINADTFPRPLASEKKSIVDDEDVVIPATPAPTVSDDLIPSTQAENDDGEKAVGESSPLSVVD